MGAFFWDYSGIGLLRIDGIRVLFGSYSVFGMKGIPFSQSINQSLFKHGKSSVKLKKKSLKTSFCAR